MTLASENTIKVWDPLVRFIHVSLIAVFTTAYFSAHDWLDLHVWSGYALAALVVVRLVWGWIGTEHTRFRAFVFGPRTVALFLRDMVLLRPRRYIGHNPAGGAMVIALLISLAGTTLSGMKYYAVDANAGPFAAIASLADTSNDAAADEQAYDEVDEYPPSDTRWETLHEFFVNLTLLLVFVHIGGVLFMSLILHENLPLAILTGKKHNKI